MFLDPNKVKVKVEQKFLTQGGYGMAWKTTPGTQKLLKSNRWGPLALK